eukprot:4337197-Pyramimonas_sp.AAC.1
MALSLRMTRRRSAASPERDCVAFSEIATLPVRRQFTTFISDTRFASFPDGILMRAASELSGFPRSTTASIPSTPVLSYRPPQWA